MKKSENSRVLPYTKKQISDVILHPETCNIRNYEVIKRLDERSWIEDYGNQYLMKFTIVDAKEDCIILERHPFAQGSTHVTRTTFRMEDVAPGQVCLTIHEKVAKGNVVRRMTKFIENHDENVTYYTDIIARIQKCCIKRK